MSKDSFILLRGGGDLASGVALRLHRAGIRVVITELAQPLAVRRMVSFAEAVYEGEWELEGIRSKLIEAGQLSAWDETDVIPVLIDPNADIISTFYFPVVVDARLIKSPPSPLQAGVPLHIGLGPGFSAGNNCHAVIETRRSHTLGRVYWEGAAQPDSGEPEGDSRRVLRTPAAGIFTSNKNIGEHVNEGEVIAMIDGQHTIVSPFGGMLRGLIRDGLHVTKGLKIGDVDPRDDASLCILISDKALSIGGGVLEAVLSMDEIRKQVYS
ncbi:MAG TPA: selenium-dependent molybdenum cofactor biosynthesis protein YqeB [Anaerolineales bacterium]|nr:selenium-dependent molybdenum cofactor biosynthesis protein YqeB [Anaerolineales bacterium]